MLYGHSMLKETTIDNVDLAPFVEMIAYDDISRMDTESIQEFVHSELANVMLEKGTMNKPTMVRLSKQDDFKRRVKLCAYQLAKEDNNPHWQKMIKYRGLWKEERDKVMEKYGARAEKIAKQAQKDYLKNGGTAVKAARKESK